VQAPLAARFYSTGVVAVEGAPGGCVGGQRSSGGAPWNGHRRRRRRDLHDAGRHW
jgi:hypothetical protein